MDGGIFGNDEKYKWMKERKNFIDDRVRILRNVCYDNECSVRNGCELMSNVLCIFISRTENGLEDHTVTQ
jgi:hypothetical protein